MTIPTPPVGRRMVTIDHRPSTIASYTYHRSSDVVPRGAKESLAMRPVVDPTSRLCAMTYFRKSGKFRAKTSKVQGQT
jgi:hypothetical protein